MLQFSPSYFDPWHAVYLLPALKWRLGDRKHLWTYLGFPGGSDSEESAWNAGDPGSIPGWGRFPREGNGNPLQYSCLENSVDREAWRTTVHGVAMSHKALEGTCFRGMILFWVESSWHYCFFFFSIAVTYFLPSFLPFFKVFIYLTAPGLYCLTHDLWSLLRHMASVIVACDLSVVICGTQSPDQGLNSGLWNWECGVLAPGSPGKSGTIGHHFNLSWHRTVCFWHMLPSLKAHQSYWIRAHLDDFILTWSLL